MRWTLIDIDDADGKARRHLLFILGLGASEHTLARLLLDRANKVQGRFQVYVFPNVDWSRVEDFRWSPYRLSKDHIHATDESATYERDPVHGMIEFIQRFLTSNFHGSVILQNACARKSYPYVQAGKCLYPPIFLDEEVYHVVDRQHEDAESIDDAMRAADNGLWWLGVCTTSPSAQASKSITSQYLESVVDNSTCVFVEIFDGEGYLLWLP